MFNIHKAKRINSGLKNAATIFVYFLPAMVYYALDKKDTGDADAEVCGRLYDKMILTQQGYSARFNIVLQRYLKKYIGGGHTGDHNIKGEGKLSIIYNVSELYDILKTGSSNNGMKFEQEFKDALKKYFQAFCDIYDLYKITLDKSMTALCKDIQTFNIDYSVIADSIMDMFDKFRTPYLDGRVTLYDIINYWKNGL